MDDDILNEESERKDELFKETLSDLLGKNFFDRWLLRGAQRQFSDFISNEPHGFLLGALIAAVLIWVGIVWLIIELTI